MAAQIAKPGRKKRLITATTRISPKIPFSTSIVSRSRTMLVMSLTTSNRSVSGRARRSEATSFSTLLNTSSASAPSALSTCR